jgi:hypothetical protein
MEYSATIIVDKNCRAFELTSFYDKKNCHKANHMTIPCRGNGYQRPITAAT